MRRKASFACSTVNTDVSTSTPSSRSRRNTRVTCGTSNPISISSCAWVKTSRGVPVLAIRPSFITTSRVTLEAISSIEWLTIMTVAFCAFW